MTTDGHVVLLTLGPSDLRPAHLMDLQGKTIRFTPEDGGYQVQALSLQWDSSFGPELFDWSNEPVELSAFSFPFSGQSWDTLYVNTNGTISFGTDESGFYDPVAHRFLLFREFAGAMTHTLPIISPLFHKFGLFDPDGVNHRYVKELADRLVVTWVVSEPYRDVFAFTSSPMINRFQVVLRSNGVIEFSYHTLAVQEGIVGVFPVDAEARSSWTLEDAEEPGLAGHRDILAVTAAVTDVDRMRFTFITREPPLLPGNSELDEMFYRVFVDTDEPFAAEVDFADADADFGVFGDQPDFGYAAYSSFVDGDGITVEGNSLSFEVDTAAWGGAGRFSYFADAVDFDAPPPSFDQAGAKQVQLPVVLAAVRDPQDVPVPGHLDIHSVTASMLGNHSLQITFTMRGPVRPRGTPGIEQVYYRAWVDLDPPFVNGIDFADADIEWGIFGGSNLQYSTYGPGISGRVDMDGASISMIVPISALGGATQFALFADVVDFALGFNNFDLGDAVIVTLPAGSGPVVDLSTATGSGPARPVVYEAFYHADVPSEREMAAKVIAALGDKFDFFAFYTDFRIDRQETGAVFSGLIGNLVSGIGDPFWQPGDWGSAGRIQGAQLTSYIHTPLASESGTDLSGSYTDYGREVTLLSHELGHRWLSQPSAIVGGNPIPISDGAPHWLFGLHAPALFPAELPAEASVMGGAYWQDNGNGTFTDLTQPFFQMGGYSPMDLYFTGLLPEVDVPPFFLVQGLSFVGLDANQRAVYIGTRQNLTIQDVIAVRGPRLPAFANSQKRFNLALVGVVSYGAQPSAALRERLHGIRDAFTTAWTAATGGVGTMTAVVAGDFDDDGDVDLADVGTFTNCASGPSVPQVNATCLSRADLDGDGDVDQADFGKFQQWITGP